MATAKKAYCRYCGATIAWIKTSRGKNMPVNYQAGMDDMEVYTRGVHKAHWETCPKREQVKEDQEKKRNKQMGIFDD